MSDKLKYRMGRVPMFCFAVDVSPQTGKLHLHGGIEDDPAQIEKAMKGACGKDWTFKKKRATRRGPSAALQPGSLAALLVTASQSDEMEGKEQLDRRYPTFGEARSTEI
jgi:hypothetical protein